MATKAVHMSPSSHPTNDNDSVFVYICDTEADVTALTPHRPGDEIYCLASGAIRRWDGSAYVEGYSGIRTTNSVVLTDNVATTFATIDVAGLTDKAVGVAILYMVQVVDAAHKVQGEVGIALCVVGNENGTATANMDAAPADKAAVVSGGTNAVSFAATVATTVATLKVTADTSLTPSPAGQFLFFWKIIDIISAAAYTVTPS